MMNRGFLCLAIAGLWGVTQVVAQGILPPVTTKAFSVPTIPLGRGSENDICRCEP